MLFVLSAPSGTGKTTIAHRVLSRFDGLRFSVSATTRTQREGEQEGVDYYFFTMEEFQRNVNDGAFVEWEEVFGNLYGTLRSEIDRALEAETHLLFDVDVKGALSLQKAYPRDSLLIFIKPPDLEALRRRLETRGTDDDRTIERRLERAAWEMEQIHSFNHVVVNDKLDRATEEVHDIIANAMNMRPTVTENAQN